MTNLLAELGAIDIRPQLPRQGWIIGIRDATTSLTWHWNGPAVAPERQHGAGLIWQLIADSAWQMQPGWGGTRNGAPHLMYTIVVDVLGTVYVTAGLDELLWHCAHADGNGRGLALHYPLGEGQQPTPIQLAAGIHVTEVLRDRYKIPRDRVVGHLEWKHATACPGPSLMAHVRAYRAGQLPFVAPTPTPPGLRKFEILPTLTLPARVRQAPATRWPDGREVPIAGRLKPGTPIYVDVVKTDGELVNGSRRWVHMARVEHEQADLGFVSETLGRWL
jgi:hypothetical protein